MNPAIKVRKSKPNMLEEPQKKLLTLETRLARMLLPPSAGVTNKSTQEQDVSGMMSKTGA
jgi:hypothetical protein